MLFPLNPSWLQFRSRVIYSSVDPECFPSPSSELWNSPTSSSIFFSSPFHSILQNAARGSPSCTCWATAGAASSAAENGVDMRPGPSALICCLLFSLLQLQQTHSTPLTCYSRALGLSEEVMTLLEKIHNDRRTVRNFLIFLVSLLSWTLCVRLIVCFGL